MCEFHFLRECFFHSFQHNVTSLTIYVFDFFNVFVQIVHIQESVSDQLVDCGGLQVSTLFDEVVFHQVFFGCTDPADTQTRSQDLGACAQEYNQIFCIQGFQGRHVCTFETQFAVRVVFDYRDFISVNDIHEFMTSFQRPCFTCGVLEVGDNVDHFYVFCCSQDFFQFFCDHTVIISRNFDESGFTSFECVYSTQVGRAFQQNNVAGVQEDTSGEIQTLLRTACDQNVIDVCVDTVFRFHSSNDFFTQRRQTFCGCILQSNLTNFVHNFDTSLFNAFTREQFRSGHTTGKGDDVGFGCQRQQFSNFGTF